MQISMKTLTLLLRSLKLPKALLHILKPVETCLWTIPKVWPIDLELRDNGVENCSQERTPHGGAGTLGVSLAQPLVSDTIPANPLRLSKRLQKPANKE